MVLESTMICVDDSDFMRNGDFVPTRLAAMQDAVNIVCVSKTRSNPENNVGLLTLASSEVLTTLTTDVSKLMSKILALQPQGELKLMSGLRVAHLALKHRQGKNHRMRIIVFVGSPMEGVDQGELVKLAKRLKKEKVNVDVISFGESGANEAALAAFVETLNGKGEAAQGGSHLLSVAGSPSLTDALVQSPILAGEDGVPPGGLRPGGGGYDYGLEGEDPELALALRVSMEEQRARQEAEARAAGGAEGRVEGASNEEAQLEQALQMSMEGRGGGVGGAAAGASLANPDFSSMSEEEQIAYAMQMSMQEHANAPADKTAAAAAATTATPAATGAAAVKGEEEAMEVEEEEEEENPDALQAALEGIPKDKKKDKK